MPQEFTLLSSPPRRQQRDYRSLNELENLNTTFFVPPSITDEQYIVRDRQVGVAVQSIEILDSIANGSIAVLGSGRLVVL